MGRIFTPYLHSLTLRNTAICNQFMTGLRFGVVAMDTAEICPYLSIFFYVFLTYLCKH